MTEVTALLIMVHSDRSGNGMSVKLNDICQKRDKDSIEWQQKWFYAIMFVRNTTDKCPSVEG